MKTLLIFHFQGWPEVKDFMFGFHRPIKAVWDGDENSDYYYDILKPSN